MKPMAAPPNNDIVFMKVVDAAPPNKSRPCLTNSRQRGNNPYDRQQRQDHFLYWGSPLEDSQKRTINLMCLLSRKLKGSNGYTNEMTAWGHGPI